MLLLILPYRDSIIDINSRALSDNALDMVDADNPDYKNLQYSSNGMLQMESDASGSASFQDQIKLVSNLVAGGSHSPHSCYENTHFKPNSASGGGEDEDYMNDDAEDHTYTNHDDLLQQVSVFELRG